MSFGLAVWALFCLAADGPFAQQGGDAASPPAATGSTSRSADLLTVPLPIVGTVDTVVKTAIEQVLARPREPGNRPLIILEFRSTDQQSGRGSEFERCLSLARYLSGDALRQARTVAYLPNNVSGHAVLPVLACEEVIMDPDATLGDAGLDEPHIDETMRRSYQETAERRRTVPAAIALGMLDPSLAVYQIETVDGISYVLADELETLKQTTTITTIESVVQPGDLGRFNGRQMRLKYGFVSHLADDRRSLAAALKIPAEALVQSPSFSGDWRPLRIDLWGRINNNTINWILRSAQQQLARGNYNFLCVVIESPGGAAVDSVRLADYLADLDPAVIRTVAYLPREARADAALVALACDQLVMAEEAVLGGPGAWLPAGGNRAELHRTVKALVQKKGRDWSLAASLVDPTLTVHRYTRPGGGPPRYLSASELAEQPERDQWVQQDEIATQDGLRARAAEELGLVRHVASDFSEVRRIYRLGDTVERLRPNWAHRTVELLASPRVAGFLLFLGWFGLFAELSQPGLSLPGFLAALCFLLYFWSNFLHGTAGWLEVLLFVAGVTALGLEIFALPGFGVFGLGGGLLIVASIILASQTFVIPRNSYQLGEMTSSLTMVVAAVAGGLTGIVVMRRYLSEMPVLRRLLLPPLEPDELEELDVREALADFDYLLGKRGRTTTPLNPSGKASFGDDVVSVISEGEPIAAGVPVYVAEVHGNRVLVKMAEPGAPSALPGG